MEEIQNGSMCCDCIHLIHEHRIYPRCFCELDLEAKKPGEYCPYWKYWDEEE